MQSDVTFSVIIPTYNRAGFIRKTIQSVLDQSFGNFEIIVVDDGSTDNTEELLQSIDDERLIYFRKTNEERAVARNTGAKRSRGTYVTFLDSDDLLYPEHLETAWKTISATGGVFVHLGYEIRNARTSATRKIVPPRGELNRQLIAGNFLSCHAVFLRRDVALANPFNEDRRLSALEDWELWLRIATQYPIQYSPQVTSAVIDHDERSVLQTDPEKLIERVSLLLKYVLGNSEVTAYYRSALSQFKSSCYTYIALHVALTKRNRGKALRYLLKGIAESPQALTKRRFLAIIKHLLIA